MSNITYIDSDVIVNDVKNRMSMYFASNKVDESIFPRILRKCVGYMGMKVYPEKRAFLSVTNCRATLPKDFRKMTMALLCSNSTLYIKDPRQFKTSQEAVCDLGANSACCEFPTEVWQDCDGSMFKIVQTINFDKYEFQNFEVLKVSKSSAPYCDKNCFNFRAKGANEFEIKEERGEKVLLTTVTEGQVYIEYFADLEQEFGFMIPDNEKVKDWIFEELRREVYAYLYDNGEEVQQRFAQATRDLSWKHGLAKNVYERDEVSTYYNTINKLARRYARMEKWVQGNKFSNQRLAH